MPSSANKEQACSLPSSRFLQNPGTYFSKCKPVGLGFIDVLVTALLLHSFIMHTLLQWPSCYSCHDWIIERALRSTPLRNRQRFRRAALIVKTYFTRP